jgi:sulfide:quinone oxidoreductase
LGAEIDEEAMPNFKEEAYHPWTMEGSLRLREALKNFKGGKILIGISGMYYRCPSAPFKEAKREERNNRILYNNSSPQTKHGSCKK